MDNLSAEMLVQALALLEPLKRKIVFVGGATVHLHIDDPTAATVRSTKDVDVVVAATSYAEFSRIEEALRENGFEQSDGPICRWTKDNLLLDIMPTKPEIIGFAESKWFEQGFALATSFILPTGEVISAFGVLFLLAAKIEAFQERGKSDLFGSQDFEDIATILDGSSIVWTKLAGCTAVGAFVKKWLKELDADDCEDALAGHVDGYERARHILRKIESLPDP